MDWRNEAKEKLKIYSVKKVSVDNLSDEIRELQHRRRSIRSAASDGTPVSGGTNIREDMLLNTIVLQKELEENLRIVTRWVRTVEKALNELTDEERAILNRFFIYPEKGAAERLSLDLGIDPKTVYYRKDRALEKFTYALYGCIKN